MNGWWWNPAEPGRGFFVEERDGLGCVACCHYGDDGRAVWHSVGPVALKGRAIEAPGFRLAFLDGASATLDWNGARIALEPQHAAVRERNRAPSDLTGRWVERTDGAGHGLACEDLGGRLFAALRAPGGWLLLEASREAEGRYAGTWYRFENGQALGAPHRMPQGQEAGRGEVACTAEEGLTVRMPDGGTLPFGRLLGPRRRGRGVEVRARATPHGKPASGLLTIDLEVIGGTAVADNAFRLTLESSPAGLVRHERTLQLGPWTRHLAFLVHSHLLPNGKLTLVTRLSHEGRELWRSSFRFDVRNEGPLAERVRASLLRHHTPLVVEDFADSAHYDLADAGVQPWFDRPDAREHLASMRRAGRITAEEEAALAHFAEEGYAILPVAIEEPLLRKIDADLDDVIARRVDGYQFGTSQRIRNLHQRYGSVRALWRHPAVMRYLELIFGVPARPCQTLTYIFGSQQDAHQDTVHLTPFPAGYMCGVWVALEDVRPSSGELEVFPRTHRLPRIYMREAGCAKVVGDNWKEFGEKVVARYRRMLEEGGFAKVTYRPKRGTVLIWHENLLHGGSVRLDPSLTRRSIVSHYFADGSIAYYDSTGEAGHLE
jgi:hypothetical protein